jgi:adenosylcobyric acid synthase
MPPASRPLRIEVVRLPRIANFTDFDALAQEPDVDLRYIDRPSTSSVPDCVILPGSKSTIADLAVVRAQGFDRYLARCVAEGREVVGICGGFQMLGREIRDPDHVEAAVAAAPGLGWLPAVTEFSKDKITARVEGTHLESGSPIAGYEIHLGRMRVSEGARPMLRLAARGGRSVDEDEGLQSPDGRVWGTHVHGVFDLQAFRRWWLNRLRQRQGLPPLPPTPASPTDGAPDRLAGVVREHLNMRAIYQLLGL